MRVIRPNSILLPDHITASNVQAVCYPAWSGAVSYMVGDRIVSSSVVYECLVANINCTPASYLTGSTPKWKSLGASYTTYNAATAYTVGQRCVSGVVIYECLVNTTGNAPETNLTGVTPKWLYIGYDNRYAMFDAVVGSQTYGHSTVNSGSITFTITPGMVDSVAFLDLEATSLTISMVAGSTTVYSNTVNLIDNSSIEDAYKYFFNPIILSKVCVLNLPPYDATISVTINNTDAIAKCGTAVFGMQFDLGLTQYNPTMSITDYSRKDVDTFGNYTIVQRAFSKRMSCELTLANTNIDAVHQVLSAYRATPVVWVGSDQAYAAMVIYGFYKSFSIAIPYPDNSTCSLEIEGLT
ncbi:MAG: hypothetical protein WCP20_10940 [Desulfuromonadales bacterium]